jgi:hypothetical protein
MPRGKRTDKTKADFKLANPPFNILECDGERLRIDAR